MVRKQCIFAWCLFSASCSASLEILPPEILEIIIFFVANGKHDSEARKSLHSIAQINKTYLKIARHVINHPSLRKKMKYFIPEDHWIHSRLLFSNILLANKVHLCTNTVVIGNDGYLIENRKERIDTIKRNYKVKSDTRFWMRNYNKTNRLIDLLFLNNKIETMNASKVVLTDDIIEHFIFHRPSIIYSVAPPKAYQNRIDFIEAHQTKNGLLMLDKDYQILHIPRNILNAEWPWGIGGRFLRRDREKVWGIKPEDDKE